MDEILFYGLIIAFVCYAVIIGLFVRSISTEAKEGNNPFSIRDYVIFYIYGFVYLPFCLIYTIWIVLGNADIRYR